MKIAVRFLDIVLMIVLFTPFAFGIMFWVFGAISEVRDISLDQKISNVYQMCLGIGFMLIPIVLLIFFVIFSSNVKIVRIIRKYKRIKRKIKTPRESPLEN